MYAIFKTGGKQYKVQAGDVLRVEKLEAAAGDKISFDTVIAVSDDKELKAGAPYVSGAAVNAAVLGEGKGKKVIIFKYKAKKDYRKKQGHRQPYTEICIESIAVDGKTIAEYKPEPAKKAPAKKKTEEAAKPEEKKEEKPAKVEAPAEEAVVEAAPAEAADASKMTKADIMAKLDELGIEYHKSAKKDELLALLPSEK
jgi:large subunit ribosomal protein L21